MDNDLNNDDEKKVGLTPTDDEITIEFVDHDEVHKFSEEEDKTEKAKEGDDNLEEKLKLSEDKILRLRADFENYRRRVNKEISEREINAQMEILKDVIVFIDNIERALESSRDVEENPVLKGVSLSLDEILKRFYLKGLKVIDEINVPFDPFIHESVGFGYDENLENGVVCQILLKGYKFKEKLLRPAKVLINRKDKGE